MFKNSYLLANSYTTIARLFHGNNNSSSFDLLSKEFNRKKPNSLFIGILSVFFFYIVFHFHKFTHSLSLLFFNKGAPNLHLPLANDVPEVASIEKAVFHRPLFFVGKSLRHKHWHLELY